MGVDIMTGRDRIAKQVAAWQAEIARLSDLVAVATGEQPSDNWSVFKGWAEQYLGQGYSLESEEGVFIDKVTRWCFKGFRAGRALGMAPPAGWKLVPIEPTEKMVIDGFESAPDKMFDGEDYPDEYDAMSGCQQAAFRARRCWAAMLAAAPTAPGNGEA